MGQPIAPASGIAYAFPDVCLTPAPPGPPVPVPYPNIAQLSDATPGTISDTPGAELQVGGEHVLLLNSQVPTSTGDEPGLPPIKGPCTVVMASATVLYGGKGIARFGDQTTQNGGNAVGQIMSANPTVLVGG